MRRWVVVLFGVGALLCPALLLAARGDLDPTFGSGGKVTTDFGGNDMGWAIAAQRDGKVVVAGEGVVPGVSDDFILARYTARGALDPAFGGDGKVATDFGGRPDGAGDVAIQQDGKIVAVGFGFATPVRPIDFALARYNVDGTLDGSFGDGGRVLTTFEPNSFDGAAAVLVQPDGKIVAAGRTRNAASSYEFALARYLPNGALDSAFGGDGLVVTPMSAGTDDVFDLALQADGKIVAAGWSLGTAQVDIALARYNADGSLDSSFGGDGTVVGPFAPASSAAYKVAIQRDGKILTGASDVARFNPDGTVDRSFGTDGKTSTAGVQGVSLELQPDGKVLAAGGVFPGPATGDFAVLRLTSAGRVDPTYGRGGRIITDFGPLDQATDAVLLADGKLVVSGFTRQGADPSPADVAVARYVAIRFCVVPAVRGKALAAARGALTRSRCKLGKLQRRYSAKVRRGRVVSQRPRVGARLAELAKVDLVVSRGRRR